MDYKKVYICSPYRGRTGKKEEIVYNISAARWYCREIVRKCPTFFPIAPHLYFPQFLDDGNAELRDFGLAIGRAILDDCEAVLVFGRYVSAGMRDELLEARRLGIPVYNGYAVILGKGLLLMGNAFWEKAVGLPAAASDEKKHTVVLPCGFGDRLWWVFDDDDNQGHPFVEQSNPVLAFSVEQGQPVKVTTNGCSYDPVGGPDLFLTRDEALAELARRQAKRKE